MLPSLLALAERGIKLCAAEGISDGFSSFLADHVSPHLPLVFQLQSSSSPLPQMVKQGLTQPPQAPTSYSVFFLAVKVLMGLLVTVTLKRLLAQE